LDCTLIIALQWLYPYYQNDLAAGRITKERAQEILESLFIKLAETTQCYSSGVLDWFAGAHSFQSVCLDGIGKNGQDVTNELSYMALDAFVNTRLFQPSVSVRVSSKTPYEFLMKIAQVVSLGTGMPAIVNDDVAIPGILAWKKGLNDPDITVEDARSYVPNGCIEETLPNHYGSTMHSYTNMGAVLEMALFNGYSRVYDRKMLVKYNRDARKWTTFEEVLDGAKAALEECIEFGIGLLNVQEKVEAEFFPTVWQSAFMKDCIELGKSKEEGGARYNCNTLCNNIGVSDMGDSLAAIKKVVFEDRKCTMTELIDALYKNFEGYEELHAALKAAPKFGNDDDFADEWTAWVHNLYTDLNSEKRNPRGGACTGGNASMSTYLPFGKACWALPSGRKAKEPLNDAIGPVQGCDNKGTTALFNSMSKIDHTKQLNTIWNVRLEGDYFKTEDGLHRFAQLVRTFIDQKCHQMQVNCLDNEILHLAQKKPEKYRDLIVRVVGYSAFFTELTPPVQDIIITRTIHKDD
jgi:pyruvate-formate lyase